MRKKKQIELNIVYDNRALDKRFFSGYGFACVVKIGDRVILFDTGSRPEVLLANLKRCRISPQQITEIFISHKHWDHTGGLFSLLALSRLRTKVFLPTSFSKAYQAEIRLAGGRPVVCDKFFCLAPGIFSTGTLGKGIPEHSLILETSAGSLLLVGCSHPGIVKIAKRAVALRRQPILLLVGGLHLYDHSQREVERVGLQLKQIPVQILAVSHCTGEKALPVLRRVFSSGFLTVKAGSWINLSAV